MEILFVSDNSNLLEYSENYFKKRDEFNLIQKESIEKAWEYVEINEFDSIIAEENIGEKEGIEFLKEIKKWDDNILTILLTKKNNFQKAIDSLESGLDHYIFKTKDLEKLFSIIELRLKDFLKNHKVEKKTNLLEKFLDQDVKNEIKSSYSLLKKLKENPDIDKELSEEIKKPLKHLEEALEMSGEKEKIKEVKMESKVQKKFLKSLENALGFAYRSEKELKSSLWDIYNDLEKEKGKFMRLSKLSFESENLLNDVKSSIKDINMRKAARKAKIRTSFFGTKATKEVFEDLWEKEILKIKIYRKIKSTIDEDVMDEIWSGEKKFSEILNELIRKSRKKSNIFKSMNRKIFSEKLSEPEPALDPKIHPPSN